MISPDTDCTLPVASPAPTEERTVPVCIVGGGMAGLCAALATARSGVETLLVQDRAVLGGNASSEVRMWICGAHGPTNKETGYLEEIQLANMRRNPELKYPVWDSVLYGVARCQENLALLLSCAVCEVEMNGEKRIAAVWAWHMTRQKWIRIKAEAFLDCSGDSILRLSGASCRWGREAKEATRERCAMEKADRHTMGNTVLIQLREIDPEDHTPFVPPSWALPVDETTFPNRAKNMKPTGHNFWWLELGGLEDTLEDADSLRDRLIALAYGVWNYIKNHPDGRGRSWELEWIGALPGKRENVRYEGDHLLKQEEIEAKGKFPHLIGHGGWTMDDHPPGGIEHLGKDTTHYPAPSPYGIPYRCLYSNKVKNLWFAGRNISATHMALSSTRVMATCSVLGQAAGTAAAIAIQHGCNNRGVFANHLERLQRRLLDHDQWLPGKLRPIAPLSQPARSTYRASTGDADILRDGQDRPTKTEKHRWDGKAGDWIEISWVKEQMIRRVRITGDSQIHRTKQMPCSYPKKGLNRHIPDPLPRDLRLEVKKRDGSWKTVDRIIDNEKRCIRRELPHAVRTKALRLVLERPWGEAEGQRVSLFAFEAGDPEPVGAIPEGAFPEAWDWEERIPSARA